jgi:GT2 family glycosyltransferase
LVVDNQSTDESRLVVADAAEWMQLEQNYGFAVAINRGLANVNTEFVALVNTDVVLDPSWLAELEDAMAHASVAFACPLLIAADSDGCIDGTWDLLSRSACPLRALHREKLTHPDAAAPRRVQFPPMTAALFRMSLFREIGFLDEGFINYLEDVEFGLRAALAGYHGAFVPTARAVHIGSATLGAWSARTTYWNARNQVLLLARHYPALMLRRWWRPILAGNFLFLLLAARNGHLLAALRGKAAILSRWHVWRAPYREASPKLSRELGDRLSAILTSSEAEIWERNGRPSGSAFWRAYFALGGGLEERLQ